MKKATDCSVAWSRIRRGLLVMCEAERVHSVGATLEVMDVHSLPAQHVRRFSFCGCERNETPFSVHPIFFLFRIR
jgi:hypothetical protein